MDFGSWSMRVIRGRFGRRWFVWRAQSVWRRSSRLSTLASRFEGNGIWANFVNAATSTGFGTTATAGASRKARKTDKYERARDLLKQREGDVAKGVPTHREDRPAALRGRGEGPR